MIGKVQFYVNIAIRQLRIQTYVLLLMYYCVALLCGRIVETESFTTFNLIIEAIISVIILALWYINGSALNDYVDYEIDQINLADDPDRPLVQQQISKIQILLMAIICAILAITLAYLISSMHVVVIGSLLLLNIAYSIKPFQISRRGGIAPLLLPLGYIFLPFFLGYFLFSVTVDKFIITVFSSFYLHFIGRIILKDYRDVKGDAKFGKKTFLLKYGNKVVSNVSSLAVSASLALLILFVPEYFEVFRYGMVCLVAFGLAILYKLGRTAVWQQQKPLLAAFGRAMTGFTALVIVSFVAEIWSASLIERIILTIIVTGIYIWSAQQAFAYNTPKVQGDIVSD